MLCKKLKIKMLTSCEALFNAIKRNDFKREKRLIIDVKGAREVYNDGIVDESIRIKRKFSLGDGMSKSEILPELVESIQQNLLYYNVEQSVKYTIDALSEGKEKVRM